MASARILVVDDDAFLRGIISRVLRSDGHDVFDAADGAAALPAMSSHQPHLLITDILMPDGNAAELIAAARRGQPDLQILAISAGGPHKNFDFLGIAATLGANATLSKPFSAGELLSKVRALIARRESAL